jgi:hypothetical protein
VTSTRTERVGLGVLLIIFTWFTWRGLIMFYSGDDLMNGWFAWEIRPWRLVGAQFLIWMPVYRPLGLAVYRLFYRFFGFHPEPLYTFCWLFLVANLFFAYRFFRTLTRTAAEALIALSLVLVHGSFNDLYYSAGTIFDRLWFLLTVTGVVAYFGLREKPSWKRSVVVCLLAVLCMDSKESGIALPLLLFCCECIYFVPDGWRRTADPRAFLLTWLRRIGPLYGTLGILCLLFVFGRVHRTFELVGSGAYAPKASMGIWLARLSDYLQLLTYNRVGFHPTTVCVFLGATVAAAVYARNRAMIFGWLFFVITITPVALITPRPGYVLYVPELGLGLYFAAAIGLWIPRMERVTPHAGLAVFAMVTLVVTWFHAHHKPVVPSLEANPQYRLTEQFRREYPTFPRGTRFLFASDEFAPSGWDLTFNLRMLYHDKTIIANRLKGTPDQQPPPNSPLNYDRAFVAGLGPYDELDPHNLAESMRLHILRDYTVGGEMDMSKRDHSAYVVKGLLDSKEQNISRWTLPHAEFKFKVYPVSSNLTVKFWLPDEVARKGQRTLSVLVDGTEVGKIGLSQSGMNEACLPVPARLISPAGYTLVDMDVTNPYKDKNGFELGVVLLRAGFEYAKEKRE